MTDIVFDADRACDETTGHLLWPTGRSEQDDDAFAPYRQWWTALAERVTDAVNEYDSLNSGTWHDERFTGDQVIQIAEGAAEQQVAEARRQRIVLALCHASEVDKVIDGPTDSGVYERLTNTILDTGVDSHRHGGEDEGDYEQRQAAKRQDHRAECERLLRLGTVAEIYLTAAAERVAQSWCADQIERWKEANPEPDNEETEN